MLKYILFIIGGLSIINTAKCQKTDTTILYLKSYGGFPQKVSTLDSADYFCLILPSDSGDNRVNVKEFYKNGGLKFVGKFDADYISTRVGFRTGECVSYFPNGKRQSIANYNKGQKDGDEYLFYPNGAIYCSKKNIVRKGNCPWLLIMNVMMKREQKFVAGATGNGLCMMLILVLYY